MQITFETFKELVPAGECHKASLHAIPRVHAVAQKQYCSKLTARAACSGECRVCGLHILEAIKACQPKEGFPPVRSPYALVTWKLKDEMARVMDEQLAGKQKGVKRAVNEYGEQTHQNAFSLMLEEINE
jgi:hypothetical protein